jgi:hypothetical protein
VLKALYGDLLLDGLGVVGVVKETVDLEGLLEFATRYFPFPLYCDKSRSLYRALGDRRVGLGSLLLNPIGWMGIACDAWNRIVASSSSSHQQQEIQGGATSANGSSAGDGLVQGGIILFDKRGIPFAALEEETGVELSIQDLLIAVQALRCHQQQDQHQQKEK